MISIDMQRVGGRIRVASPYHPDLPARAKAIGGRWDAAARAWAYDERDEERVRGLYREIYGEDGSGDAAPAACTMRCKMPYRMDEWYVAGRLVARRPGRDLPVRMGRGAILIQGEWPECAGSRARPLLSDRCDDIVIELRDVPLAAAQAEVERQPNHYSIVDDAAAQIEAIEAEIRDLEGRLQDARSRLAALQVAR